MHSVSLVKKIQAEAKNWETVDLRTLETEEVRELRAEWASLQALRELGMDAFLRSRDWSEENVQLAMSHIVSRVCRKRSAGKLPVEKDERAV
jgi:hypothetical protein